MLGLRAQTVEAHWDTAGVNIGKKTTITLGDQLDLVIAVSHSSLPQVVFPTAQELNRNDLVVVDQYLDTVKEKNASFTLRQHTIVTSFEEGTHSTGVFQLQVGSNGQLMPMVCADSLIVVVNDVANVDTTKLDIKDIEGLMREPYTFWEIFRWVLLALIVAALVWGGIYVARKIKKREPIITLPQAPPVPAHQQALEGLETLRQKGLWQAGRVKEYHTELTDIIRRYLHDEYAIDSAEMTSDQTLDAYQESKAFDSENHDRLRHILRTADMVKFAKAEPQPFEHDQSMNDAVAFVKRQNELSQPQEQPLQK